ncbi:MAG: redoxin domain-containing protein [Planctomycetales bacterium]|nr:redoxin domain-containing protein [Planctomycetales bacterium]
MSIRILPSVSTFQRTHWRATMLSIGLVLLGLATSASAQKPSDADSEATPAANTDKQAGDAPANEAADDHPFPQRQPAPRLDAPSELWLNTAGPLEIKDLRGKFVILDFWTYCCINCIHILPELKKLEHAYPNELVVIGVHSAKFETEKDLENIRSAILRYEIEHPVVNDPEHRIWNNYFVRSWPSLRVVDPEGNLIALHSGEVTFDVLDGFLKRAIAYYDQRQLLDRAPLQFNLEAMQAAAAPLRFPGKVLADEKSNRLFISDSNHNRIVVADLEGKVIDTIGDGGIGRDDGDFANCRFDHPQGMALHANNLYVADTENHLLRKVDLAKRRVLTVAGTGVQARGGWPGMDRVQVDDDGRPLRLPDRWVGKPAETAINSPWALCVHEDDLFIAMAGPHQIWKMPLDESEIGPYAGNGREDIVDGPLLPAFPYEQGYSSFAQPSGLATDGKQLFVADSEGSAMRSLPFSGDGSVRTIIGSPGSLFTFGDVDAAYPDARLQHALGVVHYRGKLYVADTYNNKVKVVDVAKQTSESLAGDGEPGASDSPARFDEPAGISAANGKLYIADTNNHAIRIVHLDKNNRVSTLRLEGLTRPTPRRDSAHDPFRKARKVELPAASVAASNGKVKLTIQFRLPPGWKLNPLSKPAYRVALDEASSLFADESLPRSLTEVAPDEPIVISLPTTKANGSAKLRIGVRYYYCREGAEGLCKMDQVELIVPLAIASNAKNSQLDLPIEPPLD